VFVCPECGHSSPASGFCTEHGVALEAAADPLLGRSVGSYRIARLIGQGGMGRVYLAVHPSIGTRVAVKVLNAECTARPELVERFFAEARVFNLIRHENIVAVLDLSRLPDQRPYIVMEYIDGALLSRLLERAPLPLEQTVQLLCELLDALSAAHARGIVHRDLKPDNILVTAGGRAKILDFGVAKLRPELAGISAETRTGALVGTPQYMSPEQARGRPADARSDLYSVGLIAFEMLTGRRAFDSDTLFDLLRQHIEQPAPSLRALRPDLPPAIDAIVARALEKEPARRDQSAELMRAALIAATPWSTSSPGTKLAPSASAAPRTAPAAGLAPTAPGTVQSLVLARPVPSSSPAFRWALLGAGTLLALAAIGGAVVIALGVHQQSSPSGVPSPPALPARPVVHPIEEPPHAAPLAGSWEISSAGNPTGGSYRGSVSIAHRAPDQYTLDWLVPGSPAYRGIGLRHGKLLGVAWGIGNDYGLVIYTVQGGRLEGRWTTATSTELGSEVLEGPPGLRGSYRIVDGRAPGSGARYGGSAEITPAGGIYRVVWKTGSAEYRGIGLLERDTFIVAWNPARGAGVVAYAIEQRRLVGRWSEPGSAGIGHETLTQR
jgi:serine/threonine protein kinase